MPFSPESCIVEEGKEYTGATIGTWDGVTQANCRDIAASIEKKSQWGPERLYWSYQKAKKKCSIKNANGNSALDQRFVSGYKECGTRILGRNLDI